MVERSTVEARISYVRLPGVRLPAALFELHRSVQVGCEVEVEASARTPGWLHDVLTGAGFSPIEVEEDRGVARVRARRDRSIADSVGPGMRLLACGLNPSEFAADAGVGFARPGNRFWPAALAAGLVTRDRDPMHALVVDGLGMTDLVKRATPRSSDLDPDEYRAGLGRVRRLVEWLGPAAVCFVGLQGYRIAVDRKAVAGWQGDPLGGVPTYVMPSTSGLNAHASHDDLTAHLRAAAAGPTPGHR